MGDGDDDDEDEDDDVDAFQPELELWGFPWPTWPFQLELVMVMTNMTTSILRIAGITDEWVREPRMLFLRRQGLKRYHFIIHAVLWQHC